MTGFSDGVNGETLPGGAGEQIGTEQTGAVQTGAEQTGAVQADAGGTVPDGGTFDVLRRRLHGLAAQVQGAAAHLNDARIAEFGESGMSLLGRFRVRTEHNSLGRDVVQVGDRLLFGFNVFIGLKSQTRVEDVFALYRLSDSGVDGAAPGSGPQQAERTFDAQPLALDGSFLAEPAFVRDFEELYAYYRHARLLQLAVTGGRLLAAFQIGERLTDRRVFRWSVAPDGQVTYLDARGERDLAPPAPFDFEWVRAGRDREVSGRHPHLNILDTLFVETSGGDLTVKVENNTETGQGIYSEPVEERTQSLDDARFEFARVGSLILLRVLPYRERAWRGLVFSEVTRRVLRLDALLQACVQLPEDHGIIFPGGYVLQSGEHHAFGAALSGMEFSRALRSPNGEDVLFVFYEQESGRSALFVYNMVRRELSSPVTAHGYALLPDGRMVLFHEEGGDATRVHQMQVWQTPFTSDEFAAARPPGGSFLGRVGNAALVRGVSDLFSLAREAAHPDVSEERFSRLMDLSRRLTDTHGWFTDPALSALIGPEVGTGPGGLGDLLRGVTGAAEAVLDEFGKVQALRAQAASALDGARSEVRRVLGNLNPDWREVEPFVEALGHLGALRGRLLTLRDTRFMDTAALDALTAEVQAAHAHLGEQTGAFLATPQALDPLLARVAALEAQAQAAATTRDLTGALEQFTGMTAGLDTLGELLTTLPASDATQRTAVVEALGALYARVNGARARADARRRTLGSAEATAQFAAAMTLFGQSVTSALGRATTPERTERELARLLLTLEELEGQFSEFEAFLPDLTARREETLEAFEAHRQAQLDDRTRRAQALSDAAARILGGLPGRAARLTSPDELNAFFAGDTLILKLRDLGARLRDLGDSVRADDLDARLKATRDQAARALRDRRDLFEDGGAVIRLGPRHRFSVNTQPLDLTLLPRGDTLTVHLTGTEFTQPLRDPALDDLRDFWPVTLESESPDVSRAEFLAGQILHAARHGQDGLDLPTLDALAADPPALARRVTAFAAPRYREGYEKGVHDHDAALILRALLPVIRAAGPLIHTPDVRALGALHWAALPAPERTAWQARVGNAHAMHALFGHADALNAARAALAGQIARFVEVGDLPHTPAQVHGAAAALTADLRPHLPGDSRPSDSRPSDNRPSDNRPGEHLIARPLTFTAAAAELEAALNARLDAAGLRDSFRDALDGLRADPAGRWALVNHWLTALSAASGWAAQAPFVPEAAALILGGDNLPRTVLNAPLTVTVTGLLSSHPRIGRGEDGGGTLTLAADETLARLQRHRDTFVPAFHAYQERRQAVIAAQRARLRLDEYRARPLTSFVRNRLISEVYLPIIGDNLAKQMGTAGEGKRSDLMGLLLLISPPGYGKTTLMEYVAHRLGLVFMKINGPSLGHGVRSLDPAQAPDATSRQELEKLNLALEMGSNVMLYLDDIQHTHPEFLQKFISLTDGTRRIEGVWEGQTRTYDLRGRRFAVVMAGNPYTESGEVFRIPDMLANRADVYNLGDVLRGTQDTFALSYIENALTSNPLLAPLATRDLNDLYHLVAHAQGQELGAADLKHPYSPAEVSELTATLERLIRVRETLARVNAAYIASAAQEDRSRTEPPFRLQGSYRNMNKLAAQVSPVMNDTELQDLITDHYRGEAQLLTTGAEENLLKLAELRGLQTPAEQARWEQIRADYRRSRAMGGAQDDLGGRVVAQLADIASGLGRLGQSTPAQPALAQPALAQPALAQAAPAPAERLGDTLPMALREGLGPLLEGIAAQLHTLSQRPPLPQHPAPQHPVPPAPTPDDTTRAVQAALTPMLAPLLTAIATGSQRQDDVNAAIHDLITVIRDRQTTRRPSPSPGAGPSAGRHDTE
ncbi:DNA repair ATPase [Deinococcus knuensis]|uniref:AAA+ ATPase domain-containing protein n=1 Tax=Deinococcus knuensis TaxID=1837380 RepID=A0ABQ2SP06_9DEIO|nr:DNA repair ATPase [Deinococcus knuensis]GGS35546.1 hypothetical protein GCM10008961_29060 [Deinococcus knuensis]